MRQQGVQTWFCVMQSQIMSLEGGDAAKANGLHKGQLGRIWSMRTTDRGVLEVDAVSEQY